MSKSTLSITIGATLHSTLAPRIVEVPCRLPAEFTVIFKAKGLKFGATAYITDGAISDFETNDLVSREAEAAVNAAWQSIRASLGLDGVLPPGSPLPAIALAYEAEVAAYDAALKAHAALPRVLHSLALAPTHPSESDLSPACLMLRKYVEHVVEQACKAQTERAEQAAKEAK